MTTMDSDSESQDSDEGRRFRFEATRKDGATNINSRRPKSSSSRPEKSRRSRSPPERAIRQRRDRSKSRESHRKIRETGEPISREGSRHFRDFEKSSNHREPNFSTVSPKFSRSRDSKNSEKKSRSHDRLSSDKRFPSEKQREKFRDSHRSSRDHSREKYPQSSRMKSCRSRDETARISLGKKICRKNDEGESKSPDSGAEKFEINNETPVNDLKSSHNCKDLNLSDFDIVSDTEKNSSDDSSRKYHRRNIERNLSQESRDNHDSIKKRVSKQHYERLLKRQAVKKRRNLEEIGRPKARNGHEDASRLFSNPEKIDVPSAAFSANEISSNIIEDREKLIVSSEADNIFDDKLDYDDSRSNDSTWGPALPPKAFTEQTKSRPPENSNSPSFRPDEKSPKIPKIVGPHLPENFSIPSQENENELEDTFGPALPPHLTAKSKILDEKCVSGDEKIGKDEEKFSVFDDDDDDDFMGPLPADHPALKNDVVQQQLEKRARRLKAELAACDDEDEKKREEWMIELPPAKSANLGPGPRKFRTRPAPDMSDRSSWTDTPADKARKRMERLENKNIPEPNASSRRHGEETSIDSEKSKKRQKSLLEIHQKKLNKKKKKEEKEAKKIGKKAERRPFDRDVDLQANRFDEARKKKMFLKARELDDRFARGQI